MAVPLRVPPARPVFSVEDRDEVATMVSEALATGAMTLGPRTVELEQAFAKRHLIANAIAVSSGTSALEIALRIMGVEGRDVVVPTNTFFATAAAVLHAGGHVRFADVDLDTLSLSAASVEAALTPNTAAVVLVHIGGAVAPSSPAIAALCAERGIDLLEDAAHAHGSDLDGRPAGSFGRAAAFSFYPTKVMASGEGGMIITDEQAFDDEARIYRDQGKAGFLGGDHVRLGYAWRISEVHAAIGLTHLRRLPDFIDVRRRAAAAYDSGLAGVKGVTPMLVSPDCASNWYKYVALLDPGIERIQLKKELRTTHGVALSGEVYSAPLHHQPVFADLASDGLRVAEDVCARHVCLPVHSDMSDDEIHIVIAGMEEAVGKARG
jgi:dTDP-4-amino-4,6-dideoxygalactose transaminase